MATAVGAAHRNDLKMAARFVLLTAIGGLAFLGMQANEWYGLIHEGARLTENPWGPGVFTGFFFMITGFHGFHVSVGVLFLLIVSRKVWRGDFDEGRRGFFTTLKGRYGIVEEMGLYWHFVDLVWVFIFAFFYLW
jgi:cytochrome c oxidase subunit 3